MANGMKRVRWEEIKDVQVPPSLQMLGNVGFGSGLVAPGATHLCLQLCLALSVLFQQH